MPLFHIHGISINVLASALSGASVRCTGGFREGLSVEGFFACLRLAPRPTWYSAVPTMHLHILEWAEQYRAEHDATPSHSLQFVRNCSAALLPTISRRLEAALEVEVLPTYAMTECMPICSNPSPRRADYHEARKLRSVGF